MYKGVTWIHLQNLTRLCPQRGSRLLLQLTGIGKTSQRGILAFLLERFIFFLSRDFDRLAYQSSVKRPVRYKSVLPSNFPSISSALETGVFASHSCKVFLGASSMLFACATCLAFSVNPIAFVATMPRYFTPSQ